MRLSIFFLILVFVVSIGKFGFGYEKIDRFSIGEVVKIKSKVLGEERIVFVNYPNEYNSDWRRYPVLYVLIGERTFPIAASMVQFLAGIDFAPPMIVVAVPNAKPLRDLTFTNVQKLPNSGGGDNFIRFFKEELIPAIDKNYRTQPFRILSGHSLSGLFVSYTMFKEPSLFQAYLTSSPWLEWENQWFLKLGDGFFKQGAGTKRFYYFSMGVEPQLKTALSAYKALLEKSAISGLKWKFETLSNESHQSNLFQSMYNGLRWLFDGWKLPKQKLFQGLAVVKNHYKALSQKYGYQIQAPPLVLNDLGYGLMDQKKYKEAIEVYNYSVKLYPNSWFTYHNLGFCYQKLGQTQEAIRHYEKSLKLNPKNTKATERLKEIQKQK